MRRTDLEEITVLAEGQVAFAYLGMMVQAMYAPGRVTSLGDTSALSPHAPLSNRNNRQRRSQAKR